LKETRENDLKDLRQLMVGPRWPTRHHEGEEKGERSGDEKGGERKRGQVEVTYKPLHTYICQKRS